MFLSAQQHQQDVDVARRNARDTAGLCQRFRVDAAQLLASLCRKGMDLFVAKLALDADVLQP